MLTSLLGKKIGMTQLFDSKRNVIPVSVVDINDWFVTQIKTQEKDGYCALQLGLLRTRYRSKDFSFAWLRKMKNFFAYVREVSVDESIVNNFKVGQKITLDNIGVQEDDAISVTGTSIGLGFQGVVKRWGFAGGPASHGSNFHRRPGSIGNLTTEGNVIKGLPMAGHCGCERVTTKGLRVVRIDKENGCLFVKGAVPGKKNSLILIRKQG